MRNIAFLFLLAFASLAQSQEGVKYLPRDLILKWSFPTDDQVQFTLSVPSVQLDTYQWVGIGLKFLQDGESMRDMDAAIIHIGETWPQDSRVEDRWSERNGRPDIDVEEDGNQDLEMMSQSETETGADYTWKRKLVTSDIEIPLDNEMIVDGDYYVLWAFGIYNDEGDLKRHENNDKGTEELTLSTDYYDDTLAQEAAIFLETSIQGNMASFLSMN